MTLKVGDEAPDFETTTSDGRGLKLSSYRGAKNVVLYFYPKDFTKVCTQEACGFRDLTEDASLGGEGTEIIGVSLDSDESHRRFAVTHGLKFPLVADHDRSIARKYGAIGPIRGLLGLVKRVTYVIDKRGRIAGVFAAEMNAATHLAGVRNVLSQPRS